MFVLRQVPEEDTKRSDGGRVGPTQNYCDSEHDQQRSDQRQLRRL